MIIRKLTNCMTKICKTKINCAYLSFPALKLCLESTHSRKCLILGQIQTQLICDMYLPILPISVFVGRSQRWLFTIQDLFTFRSLFSSMDHLVKLLN